MTYAIQPTNSAHIISCPFFSGFTLLKTLQGMGQQPMLLSNEVPLPKLVHMAQAFFQLFT